MKVEEREIILKDLPILENVNNDAIEMIASLILDLYLKDSTSNNEIDKEIIK